LVHRSLTAWSATDSRSILIFTLSAANSDQYIATRTLYGMAKDGNAPRVFTKCTKRGVPWVSFMFTGMFMGLAFLVASSDALTIFNYFVSTVTIFGSLTWISILSSHVAFMRGMKAQGISRDTLPYKAVRLTRPILGTMTDKL
jgi:amino acid transporter